MSKARKVVVIGGVAAGPKTASKVGRLDPEAEITLLEKGDFLSYAGCGLPYYVSGDIKEQQELLATPAGTIRDALFFEKVKNIRVLTRSEALAIDRKGKRVRYKNHARGEEVWLDYDALVLAAGATPIVPALPGVARQNVFTLHNIPDAEGVKALVVGGRKPKAVIVGGGLIGVETAEALAARGCQVTLVEMLPQILNLLDWEMAQQVQAHMEGKGVTVLTGTQVTAIEGNGRVEAVLTGQGRLDADLVVMAVGVRPNVGLAHAAGIALGTTGAIRVDQALRTSDPDIYAVGDCTENTHLVTGKPCFVPLGSTANKHGRVAAINICGGNETFPGVLGSMVCKVFDFCAARTGLSESEARQHGYDAVTVLAPGPDRAHYMPAAKLLLMKMVVERGTRRILGLQAAGPGEGAKRNDVAVMAITAGMTVDQLAKADLSYAPPFSPAIDNIINAADVARNKLDGHMKGVTPMQVREKQERGDAFLFLDVRSPAEFQAMRLPGSVNIPLGALRSRLGELDKDQEIIAFCKISLRGYHAALILEAAGFANVKVMDGGVAMWPYEKA